MKAFLLISCLCFSFPGTAQVLPKGKLIYTHNKPNQSPRIYQSDIDGMREQELCVGEVPCVSPDAGKMAYVSLRRKGKSGEICVFNMQTKKILRVFGDDACYPQWSPDGKQILFESFVKGYLEVYVCDTNGKNTRKLVSQAQNAVWSPDGNSIAFMKDYDIYTLELRTKKMRNITNTPVREKFPAWSPDGKKLAFISYGANSTLKVVDLETGRSDSLLDDVLEHTTWTPNGMLLFHRRDSPSSAVKIGVINPDSKQYRMITDNTKDRYWAVWVNE